MTTPAWRVAYSTAAFTASEAWEDFDTQGAANAHAESLRQGGKTVVVYRVDIDERWTE